MMTIDLSLPRKLLVIPAQAGIQRQPDGV